MHRCPHCSSELRRNGWRKRSSTGMDGVRHTYLLRRLLCRRCGRIHHELPVFMVPYKRYEAQVIEAAISGDLTCVPCYDQTIRTFQRWFEALFKPLERKSTVFQKSSSVSSLHFARQNGRSKRGWLSLLVIQLVKAQVWEKATRFLC